MKRTSAKGSLVAVVIVLSAGVGVFADTVSYTDQTAFVGAIAPGFYLEDFGAFSPGPVSSPQVFGPVNGFGYSISAATMGLYSGGGNMSVNWIADPMVVTFTGNPVFAVGGNFWLSDATTGTATGTLIIDLADGSSTQEVLIDPTPTTFRGFISTSPIASITVSRPLSGPDGWPTMDNFYVGEGTAASVPAPGAILLGTFGAGLVGWLRRRRGL